MSLTLDLAPLRHFANLTRKKRDLESELRAVNKTLDGLKEGALDSLADAGLNSVPFDDMTVYAHRQVRAKVTDQEAACAALRAAGFADLVRPTVNLNTLSSLLREMDSEGRAMPPEFNGVIEPVEFYDLRAKSK